MSLPQGRRVTRVELLRAETDIPFRGGRRHDRVHDSQGPGLRSGGALFGLITRSPSRLGLWSPASADQLNRISTAQVSHHVLYDHRAAACAEKGETVEPPGPSARIGPQRQESILHANPY